MKKIFLAISLLVLSTAWVFADTLTEFLRPNIGKTVTVYFRERATGESITGVLRRVDDKFIYIQFDSSGDHVIMRDAIANIYVYKK
jgi:hypothetical protein